MRSEITKRWVGVGALALWFASCAPDRPPPEEESDGGAAGAPSTSTGGSQAGAGGVASRAGGGGELAVSGSAGQSAATGGTAGGPSTHAGAGGDTCGNGAFNLGEECDGELLNDQSCRTLGYDEGELACEDCRFVFDDCRGTENCFDARDNDGDGDIDCADSECAERCSSLCDFAPLLDDPSVVLGNTEGHTSETSASCQGDDGAGGAGPVETGPEVAYQFVPRQDGVVEVTLVSTEAELTVSLRTGCDTTEELACGLGRMVSAAVEADKPVYVLVDGASTSDAGAYELSIATRGVECGDGTIDPGEQCDDLGTEALDGCDADCQLESSEQGQNETPVHADPYPSPYYYGLITDGDVDMIRVDVPVGASHITARTLDFGNGACENGELDSYIELIDADGVTILAENDDDDTLCAVVSGDVAEDDTYYVSVYAAPTGDTPTFPYKLEIVVD